MLLICLKLFLAMALTAIPFVVHYLAKPNPKYRNIFCTINRGFLFLKKIKNKADFFARRLNNGLRENNNIRKLFVSVVLLSILFLQFLDFNISTNVAREVMREHFTAEQAVAFYKTYGAFVTTPAATCVSGCITLALFFFQAADFLLNHLHGYSKFYWFWAVFTMAFALSSPRNFIVGETCFVVLLAAYFYPPKNSEIGPAAKEHLPMQNELHNAA